MPSNCGSLSELPEMIEGHQFEFAVASVPQLTLCIRRKPRMDSSYKSWISRTKGGSPFVRVKPMLRIRPPNAVSTAPLGASVRSDSEVRRDSEARLDSEARPASQVRPEARPAPEAQALPASGVRPEAESQPTTSASTATYPFQPRPHSRQLSSPLAHRYGFFSPLVNASPAVIILTPPVCTIFCLTFLIIPADELFPAEPRRITSTAHDFDSTATQAVFPTPSNQRLPPHQQDQQDLLITALLSQLPPEKVQEAVSVLLRGATTDVTAPPSSKQSAPYASNPFSHGCGTGPPSQTPNGPYTPGSLNPFMNFPDSFSSRSQGDGFTIDGQQAGNHFAGTTFAGDDPFNNHIVDGQFMSNLYGTTSGINSHQFNSSKFPSHHLRDKRGQNLDVGIYFAAAPGAESGG
ncbi:hypothetical protein LXA43DRAFT_1068188 [Ganoderma leucocontextum]|nr:hypothetical protein LXA43DRAFT_1068188 [Ganoderma leucocontextum]